MLFALFSTCKIILSAKFLECNENSCKFLLNFFLYKKSAKYWIKCFSFSCEYYVLRKNFFSTHQVFSIFCVCTPSGPINSIVWLTVSCSNKLLSIPLKYADQELVFICGPSSTHVLITFLNSCADLFCTFTKNKVESSGQTTPTSHICLCSLPTLYFLLKTRVSSIYTILFAPPIFWALLIKVSTQTSLNSFLKRHIVLLDLILVSCIKNQRCGILSKINNKKI